MQKKHINEQQLSFSDIANDLNPILNSKTPELKSHFDMITKKKQKHLFVLMQYLLTQQRQSYLMPFRQHNEHDLAELLVNQTHNNNNRPAILCEDNDVHWLIYRICETMKDFFFFKEKQLCQNNTKNSKQYIFFLKNRAARE